jgi:hypothetical protein
MCFKHFRASPLYKFQPCSVEGCDKPMHRKGLCSSHSKRLMRHGTVEGKNAFFGTHLQWLKDHLDYDGEDCLTWPFQLNDRGRGRIWFRGRPYTADTVMCFLKHGERPSRRHEAAHRCGKGHEACVHPGHVRWATFEENKADMIEHGTAPRGENNKNHILTEADVREIRRLRDIEPQRSLAEHYGVSKTTIGQVQRRDSWAWLK